MEWLLDERAGKRGGSLPLKRLYDYHHGEGE
jgi:hypothetical protein